MTADFSGRCGREHPGAPWPIDADDCYAHWDASYVLGSLSSVERREYEDHLSGCPHCRTSVSELSGMPALLALLDRDDVVRGGEAQEGPPPPRPEVLADLLERVRRRRRRARLLTGGVAAAAAVVLAIVAFVVARPAPAPVPVSPRLSAVAMTMTPVVPSEIAATVSVTSNDWGTHVEMACTYSSDQGGGGYLDHDEAGNKLAMVVVGRDGSRTQLATWMALPAGTALPSGSTSMPIDQIASIQVVSSDSGDVLLQRSL